MEFKNYKEYLNLLESLKNQKTSVFNKKLITTKYQILGIKIPDMRKLAKEIIKNNQENLILSKQEFFYYEEILIFGFVLADVKIEESERILKIEQFCNIFDNWSVVDSFCSSLKSVKKNKELYLNFIRSCRHSENLYKKRLAIVLLMDYFLDEKNLNEIFSLAFSLNGEEYYISMALAWFFATSLAKDFNKTLLFLENNINNLSPALKSRIISKSRDSYRISPENKILIKQVLAKNSL